MGGGGGHILLLVCVDSPGNFLLAEVVSALSAISGTNKLTQRFIEW